jgi:hypothetical protein
MTDDKVEGVRRERERYAAAAAAASTTCCGMVHKSIDAHVKSF